MRKIILAGLVCAMLCSSGAAAQSYTMDYESKVDAELCDLYINRIIYEGALLNGGTLDNTTKAERIELYNKGQRIVIDKMLEEFTFESVKEFNNTCTAYWEGQKSVEDKESVDFKQVYASWPTTVGF